MEINDNTRSFYNNDAKIVTVEQRPFGSKRIQKIILTLDELKELAKDAESKLA